MVFDLLSNASIYAALGPRIVRALDYLATTDLAALAPGKHELDGKRLFVLVSDYTTKLESEPGQALGAVGTPEKIRVGARSGYGTTLENPQGFPYLLGVLLPFGAEFDFGGGVLHFQAEGNRRNPISQKSHQAFPGKGGFLAPVGFREPFRPRIRQRCP
jgi:hypothetical protein